MNTWRPSPERVRPPQPPRLRRGRLRRVGGLVLVGFVSVAGLHAAQVGAHDESELNELREQRQELAQAQAQAAAAIDVAEADAEDLVDALNKAQAAVDAQTAAVDAAEQAVFEAEYRRLEAEERVAELETEMAQARKTMREAVIRSYMTFQTPQGSVGVLGDDLWSNARDEALAGYATGTRIDDIDVLRTLGAGLDEYRAIAEEAAVEAEQHRHDMADLLEDLTVALEQERTLTEQAEARVETRLYEAQALRELDAALAAEILREERLVAEAIARARAEEEARQRAAEQAAAAAAANQAREASAAQTRSASFTLVTVRGIVVNADIATDTENLLAAMEAEGFVLGGGGYRSHQAQINTRKRNCGTSEYAIWQMRASQCRPPTARPGFSDHETGNAIDFTYNGRIITSRSSAVFQALERVAPQHGFVNLPSEPWHWSNT